MAGRRDGPEAEYVKGPASIAVENRAGIVEPPRQTIPYTSANETGQTIPAFKSTVGSKHSAVVLLGGVA